MKLIIDIDEAEYTTLSMLSEREKVNELSYYERAIANGIPYSEYLESINLSNKPDPHHDYWHNLGAVDIDPE